MKSEYTGFGCLLIPIGDPRVTYMVSVWASFAEGFSLNSAMQWENFFSNRKYMYNLILYLNGLITDGFFCK